jgi:transposase
MSGLTLGIDVATAPPPAALWQDGHVVSLGSFDNAEAGWKALRAAIEARVGAAAGAATGAARLQVVLEPTGGYELGVALWAHQQAGRQVHMPNPRRVRDWAKAQGRRAKTDRQDALLLAHYGAHAQPPVWHPLPSEVGELEQLLRRRDEVEGLLRAERNRQQQVQARVGQPSMPAAVPASVGRIIRALEEEVAELERAISEHLRAHPAIAQAQRRLLTVPGVGARNGLPLLVLLCRWQALTDGQGSANGLVAYAGLDPQPYHSGTSVRRPASISRQGERLMRSRLYMGALGALRGANPVRAFYDRLVGRGKAKKLALVAAARKILVWAWAVFHSDTPFDATRLAALAA